MRTLLLTWLAGGAALSAQAQFYAPEVYLHDAAQRLFVVEAARVHAWIENAGGGPEEKKIADVTWEVTGKRDGWCAWRLSWRDEKGDELRGLELRYSSDSLKRGAEFYRAIWRQIREIDPAKKLPLSAAAEPVIKAFWESTDEIGTERMSAALAAEDWARQKRPTTEAADAAALAGMLLHGALPILAGSCTLDYVLLARGTAWLCHAEELANARLREAWPVQLYLAGREQQGGDRWREFFKPGPDDCLMARWWEVVLRRRPAPLRDLVLFAAEPGHARLGLPFLVAHVRMDQAHRNELTQIIRLLYRDNFQEWTDMGPCLTRDLGVSGPQDFYGSAPVLARVRWLQTLAHVAAEEAGGRHPSISREAVRAMKAISSDPVQDNASKGLKAAAGLINQGYDLKSESLEPAAAVTVEDLLVFGWDVTATHMQAWFDFMERKLGVREYAEEIRQISRAAVPALAYWVDPVANGKRPDYPIDRERLEFFEAFPIAIPTLHRPQDMEDKSLADKLPRLCAIRNAFKRGWIAYSHLETLRGTRLTGFDMVRHLERISSEGGEDACARMLRFIMLKMKPEDRDQYLQDHSATLEKIRQGCPNANALHRQVVIEGEDKENRDDLAWAQSLEKLYWEAPGTDAMNDIFACYVSAHAWDAAKRFYRQALHQAGDTMVFSNTMPQRRWVLAWWEGNKKDMRAAATDAGSFSYVDITKQVIHLLAEGEDDKAESLLDAGIDRYPPRDPAKGNSMTLLRDYLPLLPALADAGHPKRAEALDLLQERAEWATLRVVLARRFELPPDDAARLLGEGVGEKASLECRAYQAWVRGDAEAFERTNDEIVKNRRQGVDVAGRTLLQCLRHDLLKTPVPVEQPDLKPAKVERLDDLVRKKLEAAR